MQTYARIHDGTVAELLTTDQDPAKLFHPSLVWVKVPTPGVAIGWRQTPAGFAPPLGAPPVPLPSATELHAQITALAAKVAALVGG